MQYNYWKKSVEFFEHIYLLNEKVSHKTNILNALLDDINKIDDILRRSKRQRKETSFGDNFYTYNVSIDPISYSKIISSFDAKFWKETVQIKLDSLNKN